MTTLTGTKELSKQLTELGRQAGGKVLRSGAVRAMNIVKREAKSLAPVGENFHKTHKGRWVNAGFLKNSVAGKSKISRDKRTVVAMVGVKPEAYYGVQFVELGTSKQSAKPWLTKAMDSKQKEVTRQLGAFIKQRIEKVAAKK